MYVELNCAMGSTSPLQERLPQPCEPPPLLLLNTACLDQADKSPAFFFFLKSKKERKKDLGRLSSVVAMSSFQEALLVVHMMSVMRSALFLRVICSTRSKKYSFSFQSTHSQLMHFTGGTVCVCVCVCVFGNRNGAEGGGLRWYPPDY